MDNKLYITLKIKPKTAGEFRIYCRQLGRQQSETLQLMLDFFKNYRISPLEDMGPNLISLEKKIKRRINAAVAIIKDIEKTQTKPTHSMLQVLFTENPVKHQELQLEINPPGPSVEINFQQEIAAFRTAEDELRKKLSARTQELKLILDKVSIVRNNFGKTHLRLNLSREEFEQLRSNF